MEEAGAIPYIVEIALRHRDFVLTEPDNPRHLQLRTNHELWFKENALNLLAARLPHDWKYVAWIDGDITWSRDDWADETRHALQSWPIVQMFSQVHYLNADEEIIQSARGFAYSLATGQPLPTFPGSVSYPSVGAGAYWHPGFAWAARRDAWDGFGGLLDVCIMGAGDWHMAWAFIGEYERVLHGGFHPAYQHAIRQWSVRADRHIKRNIGFVKGLILHHWHGSIAKRQYWSRQLRLMQAKFDPTRHLYRDYQGLWQLDDHAIELRDAYRQYSRDRDEDSNA